MSTSDAVSTSEVAPTGDTPTGDAPQARRERAKIAADPSLEGGLSWGLARLTRSEVSLVFRRRRNLALLGVLACAPILLGIAVHFSAPSNGDGPAFLGQITENGLFLAFTSLVVTLPLFLPLAVAVVSGEAVAGEAASGSLRNLLVVPVGRARLLAVKYVGIVAFALATAATVFVVGTLTGWILFPHGPITLLSGDVVSGPEGLWRALLVAGYVAVMLCGVGAIGLFVSTLTEVPMGAMAATAVLVIATEIADNVPSISVIHPYLFTDYWLDFGDLLRSPIPTHDLGLGLLCQVAYIAIFGTLAWARFAGKDITS